MRRTNQEFKEEVLRRSENYRRVQAKRRKTVLGAALCVCLCMTAVFLVPRGGASNESAEDSSKIEIMESPAAAPQIGQNAPMEMQDSVQSAAGITGAVPKRVAVTAGAEEVILGPADAIVIIGYLSSEDWIPSAANCITDYTLQVGDETYHYHSACGTVQDGLSRSLCLPDEDQQIFNAILARYFPKDDS